MGKPKIHLAYSSKEEPGQASAGCATNSLIAATVHDIYRKLGLCECVAAQKRA
jgi:hypothetical protein